MSDQPDTRRGKTLLKGHTLRSEGAPFESVVNWRGDATWRHSSYWNGVGVCSCGEVSPELPSNRKRKQWHAEHKDAIRSADPEATS